MQKALLKDEERIKMYRYFLQMTKETVYCIEIVPKYENENEAFREMVSISRMMDYFIKTHPKYSNCSFIVGISNVSPYNSKREPQKTGKRGRPKTKIIGEYKDWHIHIYTMRPSGVSTFSNDVRCHIAEKKGIEVKQGKNDNLYNALVYFNKQCEHYRAGGNGDIRKCYEVIRKASDKNCLLSDYNKYKY